MISRVSKKHIAWALTAGIAGVITLDQVLHPGSIWPLSTMPTANAEVSDTQTSRFDTEMANRGSALMAACQKDVRELCTGMTQNESRIMQCLNNRHDDLSEYCRTALFQQRFNHRQKAMRPHNAS